MLHVPVGIFLILHLAVVILTNRSAERSGRRRPFSAALCDSEEVKDRSLERSLSGTKERLMVEFKVNLEEVIEEARTGEEPLEELQRSPLKSKVEI